MICLCRITKIVPNFKSVFLKPFIAAALCAGAGFGVYQLGAAVLPRFAKYLTLVAILAACIVYIVALLLLRAISKDDVLMLPKGQKIAKVLEKHNFIM